MTKTLRVVIVKPSKYAVNGTVERFRWGFMPNSTLPYIRSMTPAEIGGVALDVHTVDEYVHTDLDYLKLLDARSGDPTLLALVGVQSHQLHRALDLAAYARTRGCDVVVGGPHPMTCDTTMLQGRGVSFAVAEADLVWSRILSDAAAGDGLENQYGATRWKQELDPPVLTPPCQRDIQRYLVRMLGVYPARGCPFSCNFCSVIKIAGRNIRGQKVETTLASLRAAKAAGISTIMFTSDNFNKYPDAPELLQAMIDEKLGVRFFVQCDTQVGRQEDFMNLMARAGCFQMFVGAESFNRATLKAAGKQQNHPETYERIVALCNQNGIYAHFSNIIGFPQDDAQGVHEHMDTLKALAPPLASFYVLCPIPGTEQYGEFLDAGLITEKNLDRFDTTTLTWQHPNLSRKQLEDLLFECYWKFYSPAHLRKCLRNLAPATGGGSTEFFYQAVNAFFHRYSAVRRSHPMSGGIKRIRLDSDRDYRALRQSFYGFDLAPLPRNLELTDADQAFNQSRQLVMAPTQGIERRAAVGRPPALAGVGA